jgi:hypothetical protein
MFGSPVNARLATPRHEHEIGSREHEQAKNKPTISNKPHFCRAGMKQNNRLNLKECWKRQ